MSGAGALPPDDRTLFARARYTPLRDVFRMQLTGRLDIRRAIAASNLPAPLQNLILRVVKATRLWRIEKADVAHELIAHFVDGLEEGVTPEKLALVFGDPDQAAHLIRRAKKRNRPLWYHGARRFGHALLIFLVVYAALIAYFAMGEPTITTDYVALINERAAAVAPEDRAWPLYHSALLAVEELPEELNQTWPKPDAENLDVMRAYLERQAPATAYARQAAHKPAMGFLASYDISDDVRELWPESEWTGERNMHTVSMMELFFPHLASMRRLALLLEAESHLAAHDGDGELIAENVYAMLRIASNIQEQPILLCDLVAIAIRQVAFRLLGQYLASQPELFSNDALVTLAHRIAATANESSFRIQLESERWMFADFLQRVYTDNGRGSGRWTPGGLRHLVSTLNVIDAGNGHMLDIPLVTYAAAPVASMVMGNRRAMMAKFDEWFALVVSESNLPLWRRPADGFDEQFTQWVEESWIDNYRYAPIQLLMPAIGKASVSGGSAAQVRDAIVIALALELHRREHGHWPESLDQLTPRYLPSVPLDRFDGQPMRYVVRNGQPIVYSIGTNHEDNGGTPAIGRNGDPDPEAAKRWIHRDRIQELQQRGQRTHQHVLMVPDGDWILWPGAPR